MKHVQQRTSNDRASHSGGEARVVMSGDHTNRRFALVETTVRRGNEPPMHIHTREDELIYVIDGEIEVSSDGVRSIRVAGDAIYMPKGSAHAYRVQSDSARLLLFSSPAGIEGFYRELEDVDPREEFIERLIVLAARYGIVITGPGLGPSSDTACRGGD